MTEIKNEVKEIKIERTEGQKLGMALRNLDGKLCVTKVSEGGAVQEHAEDIQMGDVIVGCNETDMAGMAYDDAIKVLKGLPLTVTIKYVKKSATTPNIKKRKRNNGSAKLIVDPEDELASLKERLRLVTEERDSLKAAMQTILGEAKSALE